jgi:hypothetical protein
MDKILVQDLIVALSGITEFFRGLGRAESFALALKKHGQAQGDCIIFPDGQRAFRPREKRLTWYKFDHRFFLLKKSCGVVV